MPAVESASADLLERHASCLISQHEEMAFVERRYGEHAWQARAVHWLHSVKVQIASIVLLGIDFLIVIVELYLDMEWPACTTITRDAISCCPAGTPDVDFGRRLGHTESESAESLVEHAESGNPESGAVEHGEHGEHHAELCGEGLAPMHNYAAGCNGHKYPAVHSAHAALFWISALIMTLFAPLTPASLLRSPAHRLRALSLASINPTSRAYPLPRTLPSVLNSKDPPPTIDTVYAAYLT
jgi:hypothetical protein